MKETHLFTEKLWACPQRMRALWLEDVFAFMTAKFKAKAC